MYHYILWHHIFENFQIFQRAIELLQQLTKTTLQTTVEEKLYPQPLYPFSRASLRLRTTHQLQQHQQADHVPASP
jgi:hypothetical protein